MSRIALLSIVCLLLCWPPVAKAQLRNANWVFGTNLWVSFADGEYQRIAHVDTVPEHNACISDVDGNLVLLADARGIRNGQFGHVQGGSAGALGWVSPMANFLILPHPGAPTRYVVFCIEGGGAARAGYIVVDLALGNGQGAVVGQEVTWLIVDATAKLSGTLDAAGTGYWVVVHADAGNGYYAYHLSASGVAADPVISYTGREFLANSAPVYNADRWGGMSFSVQGDRLATIVHGPELDTNRIDLLSFDRGTGVVQWEMEFTHHALYMPTPAVVPVPYPWASMGDLFVSAEFDLTGGFLYALQGRTALQPGFPHHQGLFQIPLYHEDPQAIRDSTFCLGFYAHIISDTAVRQQRLLAWGGDGCMLVVRDSAQWSPSMVFRHCFLPTWQVQPSDTIFVDQLVGQERVGGLPNMLRNYHDSHPVGMEVGATRAGISLGLLPNPMAHHALLSWYGTDPPTMLRWWDLNGRLVRSEVLNGVGAPYLLDRSGLPAGLYVLEVLGRNGSMGRTRVVCE